MSPVDLQKFSEFNEKLFADPTARGMCFQPLGDPATSAITPDELEHVLGRHFKANKSSGLSPLPLQILKHMGRAGVEGMCEFLNESAIVQLAP